MVVCAMFDVMWDLIAQTHVMYIIGICVCFVDVFKNKKCTHAPFVKKIVLVQQQK